MGLKIVTLNEVIQTEKEKYRLTFLMWTLKRKDTNELTYKTETHRLREQTYGCRGESWGEEQLGSLGWICTHRYI